MARPEFRPKLALTKKPLNFLPSTATLSIFKNTFRFPTIILIGALLQIPLSAILPTRYAVLPALGLLLSSVVTTVTQVRNPLLNEYMRYVVPGRATAQVPSASTASLGKFSSQPAEAPIIIFNIGSQFNHPLGLLAPGIKELGKRFSALERELINRREELGMLGVSSWTGDERASNSTIMITCYFRDLESLHRFAHEPMHRDTTDWFNRKGYSHIGVFHETFCVPAKAYETIYLNCRPLLLGRAAVKVSTTEGDSEWANCLADADTPVLKTQYSRLSCDETGKPKENE
ncbi:hypothetical protein B0J13DRAFT_258179 [Dactylonectria estremocensis]|uniref:Uncharacterized protein n=1 Tax=Dactylonectria estremocensis TaxID=1079267 RepID=A0A9P9JA99_9HYPO|nr:hypothetical protein B0J13DRAFT_258179 [Dactylonectria estremocensis]